MAQQRAGQKRKVVEVPGPESDGSGEEIAEGLVDGGLSDDGESEEADSDEESLGEFDEEDADEVFDGDDDEELDSDEIPSSEDEEDVRQQFGKLMTTNGRASTPDTNLMGSDTAKDISMLSPDTAIESLPTNDKDHRNYSVSVDANGNERYVYGEIDPVYDSDDSDAPAAANTIGDIPLSYYDAYPHIGYDINGRRIARPAKGEALDSLLDSIDIPEGWTGLTDPATGQPLKLSREELEVLRKLTRSEAPGDGYDPYPDMVEWFTGKGMEEVMPLSAAPEPKRRFVPSAHEHKRVMKMVKAIKEGRIKPYQAPTKEDREREEAALEYASYDVWANEQAQPDHPMNIPAPKLPPPGYEVSYHPPPEYLPDKDERKAWEEQDEEDRDRDFLPQDHGALRKVPGYAKFVKEKFERCLDLYLAPRVRRSKLNIDPESLLPKLPDPAELKPFPTTNTTIFRGHQGRVRTLSFHPGGQYVASGGDDGTVRVWDHSTGHQLWHIKISREEAVNAVAWRPTEDTCILAACCGETVYFLVPEIICSPSVQSLSEEILSAGFGYATNTTVTKTADGHDKPAISSWSRPSAALQERGCLLTLTLHSTPKTLTWHRRADYFSTVSPSTAATSTAIAIHTLSKHLTQHPFKRLKGLAQTACFHPSKPHFIVATRQRIRIYDLQLQQLDKELLPGARWISDIALHPSGTHLLVSTYDKRLLWHDLELGNTPYKTLRYHSRAIRSVAFHPTLPLFADASDDASLQIFHGKVVRDDLANATIVPLKVLRGHKVSSGLGVLGVVWHPSEAVAVSCGADGGCRVWT
ncbi:hypothetical protein LTR62_008345 [Meristemomyces frigidus]|uniref:Ribosome biogenesis protein ERB1 n=1 Tax=Meristemomyces frigidus TaxID=1508187 RepID=A0AAN7TAR9_9PEZI|nr:hypothetical protein LTR62_008345 [Meristemomyces frigidus]